MIWMSRKSPRLGRRMPCSQLCTTSDLRDKLNPILPFRSLAGVRDEREEIDYIRDARMRG